MVVSDESNSEDGNKDLSPLGSSTFPSLDELLDGFNPNNNNKIPITRFSPKRKHLEDSDVGDDEGDLDEWEDDSETESEYVDRVAGERMPLEGKIEDLEVPEELQASVSPVPTKNDARQIPTPIPESIAVEVDERRGKPVPGTPRKEANAITMPHMQTAAEKADEDDEDQAMAMNGMGTQIGNEPVEGEREVFDERVNNTANQPIPRPTEPEPESNWPTMTQVEEHNPNEKLPLVQPGEQGECRGKAASSRHGEDVDEADEAPWAFASVATNDQEPPHMSSGQPRGEGGGEEGVSWINPRKHLKGRRKSNPEMAERREVNSDVEDDAKSIPRILTTPISYQRRWTVTRPYRRVSTLLPQPIWQK